LTIGFFRYAYFAAIKQGQCFINRIAYIGRRVVGRELLRSSNAAVMVGRAWRKRSWLGPKK